MHMHYFFLAFISFYSYSIVLGHGGRPACYYADLGHCGAGAVPVFGRGVLSRRGLLRPRLRCDGATNIQGPRQLERRVPDPGIAQGPGQLSIRSIREQNRLGEQDGKRMSECLLKKQKKSCVSIGGEGTVLTSTLTRLYVEQ